MPLLLEFTMKSYKVTRAKVKAQLEWFIVICGANNCAVISWKKKKRRYVDWDLSHLLHPMNL